MEAVGFNPEVRLSHDQRALVAHTIATPGFALINQIMRSEVDKFIIDLINVAEDDERLVVAKHRLSKAAAQFYQLVISRISMEAQQFMRDAGEPTEPTDPTEGLIDMGEYTKPGDEPEDVGDLLAGFDVNEQLMEEELRNE